MGLRSSGSDPLRSDRCGTQVIMHIIPSNQKCGQRINHTPMQVIQLLHETYPTSSTNDTSRHAPPCFASSASNSDGAPTSSPNPASSSASSRVQGDRSQYDETNRDKPRHDLSLRDETWHDPTVRDETRHHSPDPVETEMDKKQSHKPDDDWLDIEQAEQLMRELGVSRAA